MNHCIKNLSFGISFTEDLKIWISQVDLSYACADLEGYGGPAPWKITYSIGSIEISIWTPHPWKILDPSPLENDRPALEP